jgi:hypothetical protein
MEKNSSIYNNKRFAQRTDNYSDYERAPQLRDLLESQPSRFFENTNALWAGGWNKLPTWMGGDTSQYYKNSIINANAFLNNTAFTGDFKNQIKKYISFMTMLNDNTPVQDEDSPKKSWLQKNTKKTDQWQEFGNWAQSERQKYSDRFEAIKGPRKDLLQKALVALKNAEIASAKEAYPNDPRVKSTEYMSETKVSEKPQESSKPSTKPSDVSKPADTEKKPQKTYEKFNYSYIPFIKKIRNENHLLFFAAMQALGIKFADYKKENELSYYTKENYSKIQSEVNKIADSEYLNSLNPKLKGLKQAALDKLFDKVGGANVKPPAETPAESEGNGMAGSMTTSTGPDGEQKVSSSVQTEAGNEVRRLLDIAEGLDNNQLQRLWKNMLHNINILMRNPQIDIEEKVEFDQRIKDIILRYNSAFYPEGGHQTASGAFFVNTPEALARILRAALEVDDVTAANDAVDKLKIIFDENPIYRDYQILKRQLAIEINQYNFGKDETVKKL